MSQLRDLPHQTECVRAVWKQFEKVDTTLVVAATGTGKTVVFLKFIQEALERNPAARILIIAHRKELITQPIARAEEFFPDLTPRMGIVMADKNNVSHQVIVATIQTLSSGNRLQNILDYGPFAYCIIDEAHHSPADTYMAVAERLQADGTKILGVTATPMRTDNDGLSKVFKSCAYRFPINAAISQGVLVPFQALGFTLPISFKGIGQTQDGWSAEPVGDLLKAENILEIVHRKWESSGGADRQTIGFTASVAQAYATANYFSGQGINAAALDGNTPGDKRDMILGDFQSGRLQCVFNCQVLTEGFDAPETGCIMMLAPTKSDLVYVQRLGRGLRPFPDKKDCLVLDFAPMAERDVIMAGDVLGLPKEVRAASDSAEEQGILLGGLNIDRFGRISTIDPTAVLVQHLNYIASQSKLAWSVGSRYTTATLNERIMVGIALPDTARIEALEQKQRDAGVYQWSEREEVVLASELAFARQTHVVLITKAEKGWWESEGWGDFDSLEEAHLCATRLEQTYGDNALSARTRRWRNESATAPQLKLLAKWKVKCADGISKGTASQLISQWIAEKSMESWLKHAMEAATQLELFA